MRYIFIGKVAFLLVKVGQDNGFSTHQNICDIINKALEALDTTIPITSSILSSGEVSLVGSQLPDIVKLMIYDGICIIVTIQDKG